MALNVISNYAANVAHRNLSKTDMQATQSLAKLSSGTRIVQAKDDAASLAIGSRVAAEVGALRQALVNTSQAASMLQIADGAMARTNDILTRMKALAVQSSSGQLSDTERTILNTEFQALKTEITRIGQDTEFNSVKMLAATQTVTLAAGFDAGEGLDGIIAYGNEGNLDLSVAIAGTGTNAGDVTISGTNADGISYSGSIAASAFDGSNNLAADTSLTLSASDGTTITLDLNTSLANDATAGGSATLTGSGVTSVTFKVGTGVDPEADDVTFDITSLVIIAEMLETNISTTTNANAASGEVSDAIDALSDARAQIGANQSRLEFAGANVSTAIENLEAARSELLDLDVASEMTNFTSKQVLLQAGVSMLAQANQMPQNLLRLFQ